MSGIRSILYKSFSGTVDLCLKGRLIQPYTSSTNVSRISFSCLPTISRMQTSNRSRDADLPRWHMGKGKSSMFPHYPSVQIQHHTTDFSRTYLVRPLDGNQMKKSMLYTQRNSFPLSTSSKHYSRAYSSQAGGNHDGVRTAVSTLSTSEASNGNSSDSVGNEWIGILKDAGNSAANATANAGKKFREVSDEITPYIQQLYDSYPYLENVIVPITGTLTATILAWVVMPRILRKLHKYATQSPLSLLSGRSTKEQVYYEKSMWSALEDPARYLATFMAFSQLGVIIAPSTLQYLPQLWRGATVLSFVWFLHRWKTNFFTSAMVNQATAGLDRDKLLALEKISSVGLLVLGAMALAEACGVPVQSLITIGGIGGVATAYASRDILGNLFSGLSLQFTKPFSLGDYIKAGSIEGQVVEMGLTTTSLINAEKYPVIVPNSLFSSQVIVNKSRAVSRAILTKIPILLGDLDKIPHVSEEIKAMLRSHPNVFLDKDAPYCFLSRIESSFSELTLGCSLNNMKKDQLLATEQEILLQAARIIKQHGIELGSTQNDFPCR